MSEKITKDINENKIYQQLNQEQNKKFYTDWAENYEKDTKNQGYNGAYIVVKHFLELNLPKESRILDIRAGTGVIGQLLKANGYENVDALDGTPKMLEIAKQKNCYKNLIVSFVTKDIVLPIEDSTYDVVIMAGMFCPGHIRVEAFEQIIRVVKQGGLICWTMCAHENYADRDEQFRDRYFSNHLQTLCNQNKWSFKPGYPIRCRNFNLGKDGLIYAMNII